MQTHDNDNNNSNRATATKLESKPPRIFDYLDYRKYLLDFYTHKKSVKPEYSYALFAKKAGLQTPNYLKRVISGERPITPENSPRFCAALSFSTKESAYFEALVNYNQAKDLFIKKHYFEILRESALHIKDGCLSLAAEQYDILKHWYVIPILEYFDTVHRSQSPIEIAQRFRNKIGKKEVLFALDVLQKAGLLENDETTGRLRKTVKQLKYEKEVVNLAVQQFHKDMLGLTLDFIENEQLEDRHLRSLTLAVPPQQIKALHKEMEQFLGYLNNKYSHNPEDRSEIAQINLQVLKLTTTKKIFEENT